MEDLQHFEKDISRFGQTPIALYNFRKIVGIILGT